MLFLSLSQVLLHIVFTTKDRRSWLDPTIRPRMHAYSATLCRDCDCEGYRAGMNDAFGVCRVADERLFCLYMTL